MTSHLLPTYARANLAFERGEGVWLVATNGERYLDFTSGVAVNALGHAHPHMIAALTAQAQKVLHVSKIKRAGLFSSGDNIFEKSQLSGSKKIRGIVVGLNVNEGRDEK